MNRRVSVWKYIRIGKKWRYCKPADVLVESPIQRTSQQYIGISTPLAGFILDPALPIA